MTRRLATHDYSRPGIYHITIHVAESAGHPLGTVAGNDADSAAVILTTAGEAIQHELRTAISDNYPMITLDEHVIMPEHLHFILIVRDPIVTKSGHPTHLGQVIAGFKKGCNHAYWAATGQTVSAAKPLSTLSAAPSAAPSSAAAPSATPSSAAAPTAATPSSAAAPPEATSAAPPEAAAAAPPEAAAPSSAAARAAAAPSIAAAPSSAAAAPPKAASAAPPEAATPTCTAPAALAAAPPEAAAAALMASGGFAARKKRYSTGRPPLFAPGYCDVQPIEPGQLETQRAYIRNNPRSRWLRSHDRTRLQPLRGGIGTAVSPGALYRYLHQVCPPALFGPETFAAIERRLLLVDGIITCDSYGDRALLQRPLLPVVCHRADETRREEQKARCLDEAARGAVLVSTRIAPGERAITDEALKHGFPAIIITDNGFPPIYHPSADRIAHCADGQLLLVTPWQYQFRPKDEPITVPFCKTMNCVAQALCRKKDDWWK